MENENNTPSDPLDWENRKLCSDPACIGVIGTDGRCKECGKPYRGDPSGETPLEPAGESDDAPAEGTVLEATSADDYETGEFISEEDGVSDSDWQDRTLCSDPACIGVIGTDGCCKECGKPYHHR